MDIADYPPLETHWRDLTLNWRRVGRAERPTLVLLHGISSGSASWIRQLSDANLTTEYQVLAWDAPGYGGSSFLSSLHPSAHDYADALACGLSQLSIYRPVILGHSLGALIASAFTQRYPQRVAGLVLADPAQGYARHSAVQRDDVYQRRVKQVGGGLELDTRNRAAKLLKPDAAHDNIHIVQTAMRQLRVQGYLSAAWMLANGDIRCGLDSYNGPCEVWCGEEDSITPPAAARQLAAEYRYPFYLLNQAGHAAYLDNAIDFNRHILRFMAQVNLLAQTGVNG